MLLLHLIRIASHQIICSTVEMDVGLHRVWQHDDGHDKRLEAKPQGDSVLRCARLRTLVVMGRRRMLRLSMGGSGVGAGFVTWFWAEGNAWEVSGSVLRGLFEQSAQGYWWIWSFRGKLVEKQWGTGNEAICNPIRSRTPCSNLFRLHIPCAFDFFETCSSLFLAAVLNIYFPGPCACSFTGPW